MDVSVVLWLLAGVIVVAATTFLNVRKSSKKEAIAFFKQQVLGLFLYAEKQDWINEDKMGWVVQQVYNKFPKKVLQLASIFFKQEDVESLIEYLYQKAKEELTAQK